MKLTVLLLLGLRRELWQEVGDSSGMITMSLLITIWLMIKLAYVYFIILFSTHSLLPIQNVSKYGMQLLVNYNLFSEI